MRLVEESEEQNTFSTILFLFEGGHCFAIHFFSCEDSLILLIGLYL